MSCVVQIKTITETRFWVETVGAYSNSSFFVQREQLGTIHDMQTRILAELRTPDCDEIRLDVEATEILALMLLHEAALQQAATQVQAADQSNVHYSRSRSPPETVLRQPER
jgi:hypothetical protein